MSFSIFSLFNILIKLYYRLSIPKNPNLKSDFSSELSLVRNPTNQKRAFLFFVFRMFWWNFTIGYQYLGIWIWSRIFSPSFDGSKARPIRNELFYFSSFRCSEETLPQVIDAQKSKSEAGFVLSHETANHEWRSGATPTNE